MTQKKEIMVKSLYLINFTYEKGDKPMNHIPYVKQIIEKLQEMDESDEHFIKQILVLINRHLQKKGTS
jgi:hypothetical protein